MRKIEEIYWYGEEGSPVFRTCGSFIRGVSEI